MKLANRKLRLDNERPGADVSKYTINYTMQYV